MGQALQVERCDLRVAENHEAHRTGALSGGRLVVRRGQPFALRLRLSGPVSEKQRKSLLGTTAASLLVTRTGAAGGALEQAFPIGRRGSDWEAVLEAHDDLEWTLSVTPPADAPIGLYALTLQLPSGTLAPPSQHPLGHLALLFNPWSPGDSVFLGNEAQRQEYVLSEEGTIFWGLEEAPQGIPWDFGQFSEGFLDMSLALLDISLLRMPAQDACDQLRSPLQVCRLVSAMLNGEKPFPVLEGCWSGEYGNGTPPTKWPGSGPILRQWLSGRCRPVRYGQSWTFAAVACSVLRSLGIPTRVVSAFAWAQGTEGSLHVDESFDESGATIPGDSDARIWLCHAWNECWMAREDLGQEYSGWQALDTTPKKGLQSGLLCCGGPAPVRAIKEGRLDLPSGVGPFFAAINSTCTAWVCKASGESEKATSEVKFLGNCISTKAMGSERCEDLTQHYKFPEGSLQERAVLMKVCQDTEPPTLFPPLDETEETPLAAWFECESSLALGEDVQVSLRVANWTGKERPLRVVLGAQPLQGNGETLAQFWKEEFMVTLPDGHEKVLSTTLPFVQYSPALRKGSLLLKLTALLREIPSDSDAGQSRRAPLLAWQEVLLRPPEVTLQIPKSLTQFQQTEATIQLHNHLPEPLTGCSITLSGRGLIYKERSYRMGSVPPGGSLRLRLPFTPTLAGDRRLTARLDAPGFQHHHSCASVTRVTAP
nr:PREDICTED: erythrocyte membrane protein band 4.2 [Anolis carolinensis]|eukprot:XP_008121298.1 PREDICTED: erythrocyte membrane protein band 4.2 [Anolis carolinensis]